MTDIFISYARPDERMARQVGESLAAANYRVWRDDQLPSHRPYAEVIEERIREARAVLVLWSAEAVRSQWVRAEADAGREAGTLVQISLDGTLPPMPFNQIQCADLNGWDGAPDAPGWRKVTGSIAALTRAASAACAMKVCVLPFQNMSGDAEQDYFSDGISEDIITDLAKVSAIEVVARNAAFALKGKPVKIDAIRRDLAATHVLEGSVRKAGGRVRISAALVDCAANRQLWADRYDRDLVDIFAIQDEISKAIVAALQVTLLPQEKKAIEQRGTASPEAYNLYLLARQQWITGNRGDRRREEIIVRICRQAVTVDPGYARAWSLMALAQADLHFRHMQDVDPMPAAERTLALDPTIAEPHLVRARLYQGEGRVDDANAEMAEALRLDPESWDVNRDCAALIFRQGRIADATAYFEKATALMDSDFYSPALLITCHESGGDHESARRFARIAADRAALVIAQDPGNGFALALGAMALITLGESERAREWVSRALLVDPDNVLMRYNLACGTSRYLHDHDAALELLESFFQRASNAQIQHADVDPDLDGLRADPRFIAMRAAAGARLGPAAPGPAHAPS